MVNSGLQRPHDRVVINLAPAELPKNAASFDLPITLGVLAGSGQLASERFGQYAVAGELSLEGRTRPAKGALSMAMSAARQRHLRGIVAPETNAEARSSVDNTHPLPPLRYGILTVIHSHSNRGNKYAQQITAEYVTNLDS